MIANAIFFTRAGTRGLLTVWQFQQVYVAIMRLPQTLHVR